MHAQSDPVASSTTIPPAAAAATTTAPPAAVKRPPEAKPVPRPDHWVIRGQVYDLFSLKPVSGAQVTLTARASGDAVQSRTDAGGSYSVRVPRRDEGGYIIAVRHPKYRRNYLDDDEPPYRTQEAARRQEAAVLFRQSEVQHVALVPDENQDEVVHNLVLLPR